VNVIGVIEEENSSSADSDISSHSGHSENSVSFENTPADKNSSRNTGTNQSENNGPKDIGFS
jgi:hypothetical protein